MTGLHRLLETGTVTTTMNPKRAAIGTSRENGSLEGTGVQDIFIFPSMATKETDPQPDGEYGSSFRMFNKVERCYDVVYTCDHAMKRLCFTKQGDKLVGKVLSEENAFWIFSDITADSFHWENVRMKDNGERFLVCEIFGKRIR